MKKLFLAWQNPKDRRWFPIGLLTFDKEKYHFVYTQGVEKAELESNFRLLHSFPEPAKVYASSEIFPLFANRLMRSSRPDYSDYIKWLDISQTEKDPMVILARSEGRKATDAYYIFPYPEKNQDGLFELHFFVHGLRYMPELSRKKVGDLKPKEILYLKPDLDNPYDPNALFLMTKDGQKLGYCPRYLSQDISRLLTQNQKAVCVYTEKVNPAPTPIQFRLLCKMTAQSNNDFVFFSSQDYQPIVNSSSYVEV